MLPLFQMKLALLALFQTAVENPPSIYQFLLWLATATGANAAFSFVAERIPWFKAQDSERKSYIILGGSVAIALAAWATYRFVPPEVLKALAEPFMVVSGVVLGWLATQIAHKVDPEASRPKG